ncbi:HIT family protein [Qipengyuania sp. CAU 1752]
MHSTLEKFGYPQTLLAETRNWCAVLRPTQVTLGSVVLAHKAAEPRSLGEVPAEDFQEFPTLCEAIESALRNEFHARKFNYLAFMMVDPQVHFHVIPRYDRPVPFGGQSYSDENWPGPPNIAAKIDLPDEDFSQLHERLSAQIQANLSE